MGSGGTARRLQSTGSAAVVQGLLGGIFPDQELRQIPVHLVARRLKHLPIMRETWVSSLGREDPLEKKMATHSSILAWEIPEKRSWAGYRPWGREELDMTE